MSLKIIDPYSKQVAALLEIPPFLEIYGMFVFISDIVF